MTNILCQRVTGVGVRNSRPPHQTGFSRQQTNHGPRQLNDPSRRRHLSPHRRCADRSCSARITRGRITHTRSLNGASTISQLDQQEI